MTALPTDAGAALRRALGPMPRCALEALLERSTDGHTAAASVRSIAADLGMAKNTAHRAGAALVRAGVIEPVPERDAAGRFRPAVIASTSPTSSLPRPRTRRRHRHRTSNLAAECDGSRPRSCRCLPRADDAHPRL